MLNLLFYDVGLAGHLLGITAPGQWETHPLRGHFFETMVISDLVKKSLSAGRRSEWFFWSSPGGPEFDLIELNGQQIRAYEIKSSATFRLTHRGIRIVPWAQNS